MCPIHLSGSQSSLYVSHALVVPGIGMIGQQVGACSQMPLQVAHRSAMIPKTAQLLSQFAALGGDHSAFAGGNRLTRVEAETTGITERSNMLPVVSSAKATRGVLHDPEVVLLG